MCTQRKRVDDCKDKQNPPFSDPLPLQVTKFNQWRLCVPHLAQTLLLHKHQMLQQGYFDIYFIQRWHIIVKHLSDFFFSLENVNSGTNFP